MATSEIPRASATPSAVPDINPDPRVLAEVVETFRLIDSSPTAVVKITATSRVAFLAFVSPTKVVVPSLRGNVAVHFEDRAVAQQAMKAALSAYAASLQDAPSGEVPS